MAEIIDTSQSSGEDKEIVVEMTSANGNKYAIFTTPGNEQQEQEGQLSITDRGGEDYFESDVYWPVENRWRPAPSDVQSGAHIDRYQLLTPGRLYQYRLEFYATKRIVCAFRDETGDVYHKQVYWGNADWALEYDSAKPTINHVWSDNDRS